MLPRNPHAAEPLDHAPANAARQERTQRESMVWRQELAILLESQKRIPLCVKRPVQVNGSSYRNPSYLEAVRPKGLQNEQNDSP